jgi:hypothetical protein
VAEAGLAAHQKKVRRLKAHLVFIDESGYLMLPHVAKTWGLRGRTPIHYHRARHRQKVSAIVALTVSPRRRRLGLLFRTHLNTAIDQHRVLGFLKLLMRQVRGPLVVVWDNINTHKSKLIKNYAATRRRLHLEHLPPYAPELNPVEWVFEHGQCHELANHGLDDLDELRRRVRRHGTRLNRRPEKLRSCVRSAHLPLRI